MSSQVVSSPDCSANCPLVAELEEENEELREGGCCQGGGDQAS